MDELKPLIDKERHRSTGYDYERYFSAKDIKSAAGLYKKYNHSPMSFSMDYPMEYKEYRKVKNPIMNWLMDFSEWLFDYCFRDVISSED